MPLDRTTVSRLTAELVGTALLLTTIVGSGITAERLTDDGSLQLLVGAVATAGVLTALILALGAASGAHLNPAVTIADRVFGGIDTPSTIGYVVAQVSGGVLGVLLANAMFDLPAVEWSATDREGTHLLLAEVVATFGLLVVIFGTVRSGRPRLTAFAVGGYIGGAYLFTSSTSFANPAVTVARSFTDTFAGIAPGSVVPFVAAQLVGTAVAVGVIAVVYPRIREYADQVVVPHEDPPD